MRPSAVVSETVPLNQTELVFKVTTPDAHEYKVFDDGSIEGFPEGCTIYNGHTPLLHTAVARLADLPSAEEIARGWATLSPAPRA